ncbi:septum formation initiator family protein [Thalassococcus profundi]|uniref:Septum formation initiator family protein n=1 Tax=Thalassococcus profundi TaxID=2282382 RepID=A0A369TP26_9RHOB|nr:septum formation initiator family protein [Thalassococcus profundi]RDD67018.1 septum formation initiator family protein [Thalassococcus profundi]
MTHRRTRPPYGALFFFAICFMLASYFTFAAVQGDYGVFRRAEISVEAKDLRAELDGLNAEVARMENLTRRLSDDYLDLDLLDQQARDVLGLIRSDEIVVR